MIRWTLLLVVLVIFASGAVAFYTVFFRPSNDLVIPPLSAHSVVEAVAEAERLGFAVKIEQVESTLPEGRVLAQSPEAGSRARKRQLVVLQVSRGGETRAVPDLRGQTLAQAQSLLRNQGFSLGDVVSIRDGSRPRGSVIAQSPAAPGNVPVSRKIDLLVSEGGGGADGRVTVPDVSRMTEREARSILTASGLKVQAVDRVYSPAMSEGQAIDTRPSSGTAAKVGDGVRLRIATLQAPAGVGESPQRPEPIQPSRQAQEPPRTPQQGGGIVVPVPGQGDVFIGDGADANTPIREANPNVSVIDQERGARVTPPVQQPPSPPPAPPAPSASGGKVARIRYQAPPLASPMNLRIELVDPSGKRTVLDRQARSGESVYLEAPYTRECVVSVYLGGEFVWQEKHQ